MRDDVDMIRVVNGDGRPFLVRIVRNGERYGLNDCLTHDRDDPMVEFYDATFAGDPRFGSRGQFVSRYYLSTLERTPPSAGIDLDGGVDVWHVSAENKRDAIAFAITQLVNGTT